MNRLVVVLGSLTLIGLALTPERSAAQEQPKAIYGSDSREDEFQVSSTLDLSLGASTVILVHRNNITDNSILDPDDRTFTLANTLFGSGTRAGQPQACTTEPFRDQPNPGFCSGFLVGPDLVVTAGHCVLPDVSCSGCNAPAAADIFVVVGFAVTDASTPDDPQLTIPAERVYRVQQVLQKTCGCATFEDWAVIRLDRAAPAAPLGIRRTGTVGNTDGLFVVGFPAGLPRKYAGDASVLLNSETLYFKANLDTYGGNSGSAVFNRATGEVEGILVRGATDYCADTTNNCWYSCTYPQDPSCGVGNVCEDATRIHLSGILSNVPRVVFVDDGYAGTETGERREPFSTVTEGVASLLSSGGSSLVVGPGHYAESLTISTPMTIYNGEYRTGSVTIGQ